MKWNTETITARLDEIENARRIKKATNDHELKESRAKLATLDTALSEAQDPEEYKRILHDKNEVEMYIDFLIRRARNTKPGDDVNHDEYRDIQSCLLDEVENSQKEYAPKIEKKLSELLNLLEEYYTRTTATENIRDRACMVFLNHGTNGHRTSEIIKKLNDPLLYADHMLRAFFVHRSYVDHCYKRVTSPNELRRNAIYTSSDEAKICEELKKRINKK